MLLNMDGKGRVAPFFSRVLLIWLQVCSLTYSMYLSMYRGLDIRIRMGGDTQCPAHCRTECGKPQGALCRPHPRLHGTAPRHGSEIRLCGDTQCPAHYRKVCGKPQGALCRTHPRLHGPARITTLEVIPPRRRNGGDPDEPRHLRGSLYWKAGP